MKKSNSIAYHAVRELVAMGESLTGHVGTNNNVADLATKVLVGKKRLGLINCQETRMVALLVIIQVGREGMAY
jgi:hypothetical protein